MYQISMNLFIELKWWLCGELGNNDRCYALVPLTDNGPNLNGEAGIHFSLKL